MLTDATRCPYSFFVVQDHADYHSPPASLSRNRDFLHQWYLVGFRSYVPVMGNTHIPCRFPNYNRKMSQHWTDICLIQALGFPCSVCKDLSSDRALLRLFSSAARSQNSSSHEKLRSTEGGKNLTFSLLFWGSSTGRAQPAALLLHPRLYRRLVWRRQRL